VNHLEIAFPGQTQVIATWRNTDGVLDEICRDFEEIATALAEIQSDGKRGEVGQISDLKTCLEGLHQEIADYLDSQT
jgi:hypothetical protein